MKTYQRYRFPSLRSVARDASARASAAPAAEAQCADIDARIEEGFRQGREDGYREGFEHGEAEGMKQGREAGFAAGAQQARDALRSEYAGIAKTLDAMRDAFARVQAEYLAARRTELVDVVAKVAKQVIRCELTLQPSQMAALIEETLGTMPASSDAPEVHLSPDDHARLAGLLPERARHWRLVPDARLEAGECRVLLGGNEADAGCQHRLDACVERICEQLPGAPDVEAAATPVAEQEDAS
ncbi:flagellar assembly protein H [Burkholderia thailandensis]|uniref:Flagellar assembly protein FliH n=1 Tax=Burkholderia thailandensis TaxID=57975 RepID=A0AAW9CT44_BURTH|nr:flagellar assembly protein FliH [Burkholderia thailandensis]MCS3394441.1 flagellar assembly protein H [Burkholderia thailandensis]MCS6427527.1 flagellar assembly protein H [Burkholderia thailandensis]MCS6455795.1 flagellar assembly protein H [Burkholderia thailandensis]MCS6466692.1 flagellar assembly protein H [Burkholderia thailandensis]MCS6485426.1 flagellar assembly protein H [Burkholderia thailandensis]